MNVRKNKLRRNSSKRFDFNSGRRMENQKNYLHNWNLNVVVKTIPISRRIRKGA